MPLRPKEGKNPLKEIHSIIGLNHFLKEHHNKKLVKLSRPCPPSMSNLSCPAGLTKVANGVTSFPGSTLNR